jgi:hypothetical protein
MGAWLPEGIALLVESVHGGEQQLVTADCPVFAAYGLFFLVGVYKCLQCSDNMFYTHLSLTINWINNNIALHFGCNHGATQGDFTAVITIKSPCGTCRLLKKNVKSVNEFCNLCTALLLSQIN